MGNHPFDVGESVDQASFHPVKHITTGEGGAVVVRDPDVQRRIERLRQHGIERDPTRLVGPEDGLEYGLDVLDTIRAVYRAAGGLDAVAQAAGRCNREGKLNGLGDVYVFVAPTEPPPGTPRRNRRPGQGARPHKLNAFNLLARAFKHSAIARR